jgi:hypothetical protein
MLRILAEQKEIRPRRIPSRKRVPVLVNDRLDETEIRYERGVGSNAGPQTHGARQLLTPASRYQATGSIAILTYRIALKLPSTRASDSHHGGAAGWTDCGAPMGLMAAGGAAAASRLAFRRLRH